MTGSIQKSRPQRKTKEAQKEIRQKQENRIKKKYRRNIEEKKEEEKEGETVLVIKDLKAINEKELDQVNGGFGQEGGSNMVGVLVMGYLPVLGPVLGSVDFLSADLLSGLLHEVFQLYNGDRVQITGPQVQGADGNTYVQVFVERGGVTGYVNAAYIR